MSDAIEAAARAIYEAECIAREWGGAWEDVFSESQAVYLAMARAAIEAYEAEQWVDAAACTNDDGSEFLTENGQIVVWESAEENTGKRAGWYDLHAGVFGADPVIPSKLRPIPRVLKGA